MIVIVWVALPESINYLVERRPSGALERYNRIARRLGYPTETALPDPSPATTSTGVAGLLFKGMMGRRTAALWISYACVIAAFYFANTWTANLIANSRGDAALGIRTTVLILAGGVAGALLFALLVMKVRPRLVTALILLLGTVSYVVYAARIHDPVTAMVAAVFVGMSANGGVAAFYAISPAVYPTKARATGVGLMIGFGRAIAILAPIVTGYMLKNGWTPASLYQFFAGVMGVGAVATWRRGCSIAAIAGMRRIRTGFTIRPDDAGRVECPGPSFSDRGTAGSDGQSTLSRARSRATRRRADCSRAPDTVNMSSTRSPSVAIRAPVRSTPASASSRAMSYSNPLRSMAVTVRM